MESALEIIGLIAVFLVGGFAFATVFALIALRVFRRQEIGALIYADMTFKAAVVVWIVLFLCFGPLTISFGVTP